MQVLKEHVRQKIIKSAKKEFKNKGYDKASMKEIADSAGMTVGNIYRYYKHKEDMFSAIVEGLYKEIKNLKKDLPDDIEGRVSLILKKLVVMQRENKQEWSILFDTMRSTKYSRVIDDVYNLLSDAIIQEFKDKKGFDESIAEPIAHAMINGLSTILKNEKKFGEDATELYLNYMV